jgi:hypothetical protein
MSLVHPSTVSPVKFLTHPRPKVSLRSPSFWVRGASLGIVVDQTQSGLAFTPEDSSELLERIRLLQVGPELRK